MYMEAENEHLINDQKRIQWLLTSLKTQNQLITLSLKGSEQAERSMVVDVCTKSSSVMLDAVLTPEIHKKIQTGHEFSLLTTHDGVDVRAASVKAVETITDSKGMLYKVPFPTKLVYVQRRNNFRVSLAGLYTIPVTFKPLEKGKSCRLESAECSVANISANGCLVSVADRVGDKLYNTDGAVVLTFELPETKQIISVPSVYRHSRYLKRSEIWLIGFQFRDVPAEMNTILERFVVKLQLAARQKSLLD